MIKGQAPLRGTDKYGSGAYLAPRNGKVHNGIDIAFFPGTGIFSLRQGRVSKIGFPHNIHDPVKGHLRYVQITDIRGFEARYFYLNPEVVKGEIVGTVSILGMTQTLQGIYPGITDHIHFEVKKDGQFVEPVKYLEESKRWMR